MLRTLLHPSVGLEPKVIIPNPNRSARSMDFDAESCGQCAGPPPPLVKSYDAEADAEAGTAPENRLGWPLLRRAPAPAQPKGEETRKQSVVHWVMSLPRRPSPSASPDLSPPQEGLAADLKRLLGGVPSRCRWFRYEELYDSTNHFSPGKKKEVLFQLIPHHKQTQAQKNKSSQTLLGFAENLVGNGGHSRVYRGSLASGQQVAIKVCKASAVASKDFLREVDIISKLQHERIVPLMGVCVQGPKLISVYRYLPRGSLEDNLHGTYYFCALFLLRPSAFEFLMFGSNSQGKDRNQRCRGRRGTGRRLESLKRSATHTPAARGR